MQKVSLKLISERSPDQWPIEENSTNPKLRTQIAILRNWETITAT